MKKKVVGMMLVFLSVILGACNGQKEAEKAAAAEESEYEGQKIVIRIALGAASTGHSGIALQNFADRVEARTGGLVDVQPYPDSQLGTETEITQGVALEIIEMAMPGMGTFAAFYEKLQFANIPFLLENREQSYAFYDGSFMQEINEDIRKTIGIKILGYGENGVRGLSNDKHAVHWPEDLKGLKIRVQENPLHLQMIKLMGGSATPITFSELYTALSQGTVDGQDNGIPLTVNNRLYEVQKYYTILGHCIDQLVFIANDAWFNGLDESLQQILLEEAENWKKDIRQLAIDFEQAGVETMKEAGTEVSELTEEQQKAFKNLMDPAVETAKELVGTEFYQEVQEAAEQAKISRN